MNLPGQSDKQDVPPQPQTEEERIAALEAKLVEYEARIKALDPRAAEHDIHEGGASTEPSYMDHYLETGSDPRTEGEKRADEAAEEAKQVAA